MSVMGHYPTTRDIHLTLNRASSGVETSGSALAKAMNALAASLKDATTEPISHLKSDCRMRTSAVGAVLGDRSRRREPRRPRIGRAPRILGAENSSGRCTQGLRNFGQCSLLCVAYLRASDTTFR